jgi:hypothetical protein
MSKFYLLTAEALTFLKNCNYDPKTHEERMGLITLARKLYPTPREQCLRQNKEKEK